MKPTSITLIRGGPAGYQVTYWDDGVARWDGRGGQRNGAWQGKVEPAWFGRAAARRPQAPSPIDPVDDGGAVTVLIDFGDHLDVHRYAAGTEPEGVWNLAMVVDGMASQTRWCPLDVTEELDFSSWYSGISVIFVQGDVVANALAAPAGLVVLAGSTAATSTSRTLETNYVKRRTQLEEDGGFHLHDDRFLVTRHLHFPSPSAAASVLAGSNNNGRRAWRDASGRCWAELGLES